MTIQAYLSFNGNSKQAAEFYAEALQAEKPNIMLFGDMPPDPNRPLSDEAKKLVAHALIKFKGGALALSDVPPGMPFMAGNNFSLMINSTDRDEIKSIFERLKAGGKIIMDLQETFWSKSYGMLTDKFGVTWQLNYESGGATG